MCSKRWAKPVRSLRLDAEADVVVDRDDRHGGRGVAREHDLQAVRELVVVDRDLHRGGRRPPPRLPGGPGRPGSRGRKESAEGRQGPRARGMVHVILLVRTAELTLERGEGSPGFRGVPGSERFPAGRLASGPPPPDRLGTPGPLPPPRAHAPRGPDDSGRRRAPGRSRGRPGRQPPGHRSARPRGELELGVRAGAALRDPAPGLARRGDELPLLRPRPRGPRAHAAESPAAHVSLGGDRRPRLPRPHAGGARAPGLAPLFAIGVSLGGNVLLKWLGEQGANAPVDAAVAISTPYDLAASADHLETIARTPLHAALPRDAQAKGRRSECAVFPRRPAGSTCRARSRRGPSASSTMRQTPRCTASPERTTTTGGRARSRISAASRRRRSASPRKTIPSFRARRSPARAPPRRQASSSSSRSAAATSGSSADGCRGDRAIGPRPSRWIGSKDAPASRVDVGLIGSKSRHSIKRNEPGSGGPLSRLG